MNIGTTIVHRGQVIEVVKGGFKIRGFDQSVFMTLDSAKQHIQMCERAIPEKTIYVNGVKHELSSITSVSLLPGGQYGLSFNYKRPLF